MNFYKRYMGDYARDTAHLSLVEHGVYSMLLDTIYATEKPLPADIVSLFRICRATTATEKAAVSRVADEFFPVSDDGLRHNKRADLEIEKHAPIVEHNRKVGHLGGRPKKTQRVIYENPDGNHLGSISKPGTKPNENPNQIPDRSKEAASGDALDPVWGVGLQALQTSGVPESAARSFIGLMLASWTAEHVLEALQAASGKADPRGYVRGVLKSKPKKNQPQELRVAL